MASGTAICGICTAPAYAAEASLEQCRRVGFLHMYIYRNRLKSSMDEVESCHFSPRNCVSV